MKIIRSPQQAALLDLAAAFNTIAVRHRLTAADAVQVLATHCARVMGNQLKKGDDANAYSLSCAMMMSSLIKNAMPPVVIDNPPQSP